MINPLTGIPGVGKSIADDLQNIGIHSIEGLLGNDPEQLYQSSNTYEGKVQDRCLLYVFRCAVYFANGGRDPEKLKWWNWKDMSLFRFSPIQDVDQMVKAIQHIHFACHALCKQSMGRYLSVAGNVGIFCHFDDEYTFLTKLREELTDSSHFVYGKYYRLYTPIVIPPKDDIPEVTYRYLYIRKPDPNRKHVGDIDFYMEPQKFMELKQLLMNGKQIIGARMLPNRPDLDLIELFSQKVDALGYIGDKKW